MNKSGHYVWSSDIDEQVSHYNYCVKNSRPYIAISRESGDFVIVTYFTTFLYTLDIRRDDLESMKSFDRAYQRSVDRMPQTLPYITAFYENYCAMFGIPKDRCLACGGEGSMALAVHRDHAACIAEELFGYLSRCKNEEGGPETAIIDLLQLKQAVHA